MYSSKKTKRALKNTGSRCYTNMKSFKFTICIWTTLEKEMLEWKESNKQLSFETFISCINTKPCSAKGGFPKSIRQFTWKLDRK